MDKKYSNLPLRSGVGIVVLNKENKVFVAKRIDNPKDFWQMPQGGVDSGEDFLKAAYRELEEETSIKSVKLIKELDGMDLGESKKNPSFTVSTEVDASVNTLLYRPCISLTKNFSFSHCMLCTCSFDLLSFGFIYRVKVTLCVSLLSVNGAL